MFNGHNSPTLKKEEITPPLSHHLTELAKLRSISEKDLHLFLQSDHTSSQVDTFSFKHFPNLDEASLNWTINSANSFKLGAKEPKSSAEQKPNDDCKHDIPNCRHLQFFDSKGKRLRARLQDQFKANFLCSCKKDCPHQYLFLTGTYNTSQENHYAWTRNWDKQDPIWNTLQGKVKYDLIAWAQNSADSHAEPMKILIPPTKDDPTQFETVKKHHQQYIKNVNREYKPINWKWIVVFKLQKNGNWHWHMFSTPFVPYSHECVLDQTKSKSCWDCRTYVNKLWPHGRVESRSLDKRAAGKYLAKYLAKSFKFRSLYQQHGFKKKDRIYHLFQNLYDYEQRPVIFVGKYRIDALTGKKLNNNQHIFRKYNYDTNETTYFYRTNRKLIGKRKHPIVKKRSVRHGSRFTNPLPLLELAVKHPTKEELILTKPKQILTQDFRQHSLTKLLSLCDSARVIKTPIERKHIPKENGECPSINQHFETKTIIHFTFSSENIPKVSEFMDNLPTLAHDYGFDTDQDFFDPRFKDRKESRNAYLDNWKWNYCQDYFNNKRPLYYNGWGEKERTAM